MDPRHEANQEEWSGAKIGCAGLLGVFILFMGYMVYYLAFTQEGQDRQRAYDKQQVEKKAAAVEAATIDNVEMTEFCDQTRQFYAEHYGAKNRLKQGQVFEAFQSWFTSTLQAKEAPFSGLQVEVNEISATKNAENAGISFRFCNALMARVDIGLYANNIRKGSDLYDKIAELGSNDKVVISGTLKYKGWKEPSLTGDFDDTWDMKLAKSYLEFLFDHADNEEDERRLLGDYWFEITIDSIEPAAPETPESDKPADTQSP